MEPMGVIIFGGGAALFRVQGEREAETLISAPSAATIARRGRGEETEPSRTGVFEDNRIPGGSIEIRSPAPPSQRTFDSRENKLARKYFESLRPHLV